MYSVWEKSYKGRYHLRRAFLCKVVANLLWDTNFWSWQHRIKSSSRFPASKSEKAIVKIWVSNQGKSSAFSWISNQVIKWAQWLAFLFRGRASVGSIPISPEGWSWTYLFSLLNQRLGSLHYCTFLSSEKVSFTALNESIASLISWETKVTKVIRHLTSFVICYECNQLNYCHEFNECNECLSGECYL